MPIPSRTAIAFLLVLVSTATWAAGETARSDYVEVNVVGVAAFPPDVAAGEARRAALADARRNALLRAHLLVEREAEVENMQLHRERIREHSAAWIQKLHVHDAGPTTADGRRLYRVRVRATLRPLATFSGPDALALNRPDPWEPVVTLTVRADGDPQLAARVRDVLDEALHGCGVRVAEGDKREPGLELRLTVSEETTEAGRTVTARWEVGFGIEAAESSPGHPVLLRGTWRASGRDEPGQAWWQSLGATMAQDVYRLWALPRWTTVRFENTDEELAGRLARLMSRPRGARVRMENEGVVVASFPLTGNPLSAVRAILEQDGISGRVTLRSATFTELGFRCRRTPEE